MSRKRVELMIEKDCEITRQAYLAEVLHRFGTTSSRLRNVANFRLQLTLYVYKVSLTGLLANQHDHRTDEPSLRNRSDQSV